MNAAQSDELAIHALVYRFYERVREDPLLGPVFEERLAGKWEQHLPRMVAFWTKLLLGRGEFQGNVYGKHMALSGIAPEHFRRWLGLFRESVSDVLPPALATEALLVADRIAASLQLGYFGEQVVALATL